MNWLFPGQLVDDIMHGLIFPAYKTIEHLIGPKYHGSRLSLFLLGGSLAIWRVAGTARRCSVWRERISQSTGNVAKEHMVDIERVAELNECFAEIIVSDFAQLFDRVRSSKLCSAVGASLSKQQVTPEAQYPPQAAHLLQILLIFYHSMKMR
jgi:hypothetical protein